MQIAILPGGQGEGRDEKRTAGTVPHATYCISHIHIVYAKKKVVPRHVLFPIISMDVFQKVSMIDGSTGAMCYCFFRVRGVVRSVL